ncbi:MAG: hypothetical protein KDI09_16310 [Halioglobus sp.]|nr:hypothetical protein [Halioglobus sp.]
MPYSLKLWLVPAAIYAAFALWYTDLRGPLTSEEISHYARALQANGASAARIRSLERFMREDSGRQFLVVNNLHLKTTPPDTDGAEPGESGEQLMARYMAHMLPALLSRACHPVLAGNAVFTALDVSGIAGAEVWQSAGVVRYRSRRSFMDIVSDPAFMDKHHFKMAALEKTIAYPIETTLYLSDPRLLLALTLLAVTGLLRRAR